MNQAIPPFRAEHVGSFLRPAALLEARRRHQAGEIGDAELRDIENDHIRDLVKMQERIGLQAITDGEFRRHMFHVDFLVQLDGVTRSQSEYAIAFRNPDHDVHYAPPVLAVTGKLGHPKGILTEDFKFLKSVTRNTPKITLPSPSMLHFRGGRDAVSQQAYPDMDEFFADLTSVYQAEIRALADAGCRYVQMDDTNLAYLCDPQHRERARARGEDPDDLTRLYARLITEAFKDAPADMARTVHLCRGNFRSSWAAEGAYDAVAEIMFSETGIDGFFLEFDDARSGGFEPLRFVPKGMTIVLGLISSKRTELEEADAIKRRIEEAAQYVDIDQLALSPQCGFASTEHGNDLTPAIQDAKLEMVVRIAEDVWGSAATPSLQKAG